MDAESVILRLCAVLLGNPRKPGDRGLMSLVIDGERHTPKCPFGQYLTPGLGGDPCSERCLDAQEAISQAAAWLREHETPAQAGLFEEAVAG